MLNTKNIFFVFLYCLSLSACSHIKSEAKYPERHVGDNDVVYQGERKSILGQQGISLFKAHSNSIHKDKEITVNSYLWRASLDTISFMPLKNADPFGGTIVTDWLENSDFPGERFKANIYILSRELRSDALKVSIFHQIRKNNHWMPVNIDPSTIYELEKGILKRARELKIEAQSYDGK